MRTDPPVDAQYLPATYLLDLVDARLTLMINSPTGLREIDALSGTHLAADILTWVEQHCPAPARTA
jgi:glutathione synthase/RimK-type ligase-like ATP-grasp enzyme